MKVLLINGSPRKEGNTYTSLREAALQLKKNGIESEILWIGTMAELPVVEPWDSMHFIR